MAKEELEKTEEYDFVIRFKSNKPKYEIRSYIINHILDEFDNLQMWDFKRSSEFAEPREKRIADLETQIKQMKCCENCGWFYLQQHWRESKEINESRMFHCGTCGNKKNWKLKEIKEND